MSDPDKIAVGGYAVFCGLDVGKAEHHACALDAAGKRVHDRPLPNDEAALVEVFTRISGHGRVLVIVDQPASIGALPIAVARSLGIEVAYLPGLAMRRIADLHPGEAKTDARDAYVIADAARTMPHTLRRIGTDDETLAELAVLAGYDDDLAAQSTRLTNRLRDALLHIHPALERLLGPRLDCAGVLDLLAAAPTPQALRDLGLDGITTIMRPRSPRLAKKVPTQILTAVHTQTVTVPGTSAFGRVIAGVAAQLRDVHTGTRPSGRRPRNAPGGPPSCRGPDLDARPRVQDRPEDPHHHRRRHRVPHRRTPRRLRRPRPVTRRSGSTIKGETRSHRGHRALKSALYLSAFASLADPTSRAYYARKRAQGKPHNAALICLTRRRVDVIYAMLRDHKPYQHPTPTEPEPPPPLDEPIETPHPIQGQAL